MSKAVRHKIGYRDGYHHGYNTGYDHGYAQGRIVGITNFAIPFEGTSIIIPTYNQLHYLQECIASVIRYTSEPYELIVIDNASTDGTGEFLKSSRHLRYHINKENLGFAGAVNQGFMLSRGTTLLILNNDAVVTQNWLSNLLACLHSDPQFGIVGPVTNYISGDQLIPTHYKNMTEMQEFSESYNQTDPRRWVVTNRLTGFCMLFRRTDFMRLGYFDEGFEIGNCEDDDYGLRAGMIGLRLVIAQDTFIHHYGSMSMKTLEGRFDQVYEKNLTFYADKWADPHRILSMEWQANQNTEELGAIDFYPDSVIAQGPGSKSYWIENGVRRLIDGHCDIQSTRISQIDLRNWPIGMQIPAGEVMQKIHQLRDYSAMDGVRGGALVKDEDQTVYQFNKGKFHKFINHKALNSWGLAHYVQMPMSRGELQNYEQGLPIIHPPIIRVDNI